MDMADETTEKTQKTQPKKGEPVEIPVPSKSRIMGDFEKIATPPPDEDSDDSGPDGT